MSIFASLDWYLEAANTVTAIYREELFRDPEPAGLFNWVFHTREEGKDADWIREQVRQTPEWAAVHAPPPPFPPFQPAPREWSGNMCGVRVPQLPPVPGGAADPSLVLSWFYDRYSESDRQQIREMWKFRGYLDVLLSWPDSRAFGFNEDAFLETCRELIRDGFRPCLMLTSKDFDSANVPQLLVQLNPIIEKLVGVVPRVCIGWELSLWLSPTQVQQLIDAISPRFVPIGTKLYVHFQQGYAAFQEPGGTTADFWIKNIGKLHGLLHQRDLGWDKSMYQARLTDILERIAGQFGWPANSGFGHPFDLIALEITAAPQFGGSMSEAEGDSWGGTALSVPPVTGPFGPVGVMGSGNGS